MSRFGEEMDTSGNGKINKTYNALCTANITVIEKDNNLQVSDQRNIYSIHVLYFDEQKTELFLYLNKILTDHTLLTNCSFG